MENIYDTNDKFDNFDFSKMELTKPTPVSGGNHFIRFLVNNGQHLYVQPPTCSSKQGIVKVGKRYYSDLMFTNENEHFIRWLENLETYCHTYIYNNREKWFDNEMEIHDIENYFTSPIKIYKSGTYYTIRSNIQTVLDKPKIKIYNEDGVEVDISIINNKTNLMTILEIQGIRCSPRSFQIDIEIKQIMALKPNNMFDTCIFKPVSTTDNKPTEKVDTTNPTIDDSTSNSSVDDILEPTPNPDIIDKNEKEEKKEEEEEEKENENENEKEKEEGLGISIDTDVPVTDDITIDTEISNNNENEVIDTKQSNPNSDLFTDKNALSSEKPLDGTINETNETNEMQEVVFNLEELPENDQITLKQRNDVYYEMYREARQKAKIARDLALSSYLEAKNIKNKYMLDDIEDSDESDLEMDD